MKTGKLTVMALTTALAMILSFIESQIPAFVAVPGVKVGLANIAVVFALYKLGWKEAVAISLVRVVLVSMLFGSLASMFYSLAGAVLSLDYDAEPGDQVTVKIGLSYTSVENAKANLEAEASALTFDKARRQAHDAWQEALGRIAAYGGKDGDKVKFYTGLYHALLGRGLASDVSGAYPRNDGTVGQIPLGPDGKPVHNHYNTDAIWGGYWNLTTLWSLAYPEYYNDWVASQLLVYKDAGWLGDGIACSRYVSGVGTNMVSIAFAGAYNTGIRNYDIETMYAAARKDNLEWEGRIEGAGKMDVEQFVRRGYVPYVTDPGFVAHSGGATFSISHTLEYSFSAYATAQMAKQLGHEEDYRQLTDLSNGWAKVFDDSLKLVRPRIADGVVARFPGRKCRAIYLLRAPEPRFAHHPPRRGRIQRTARRHLHRGPQEHLRRRQDHLRLLGHQQPLQPRQPALPPRALAVQLLRTSGPHAEVGAPDLRRVLRHRR